MGYTRNKRRTNNFRKSRQLQIKKKATRRQYKGGARQTKKRGQKGGRPKTWREAGVATGIIREPGLAAEVKAGIMDQARKNVAMKIMIDQADTSIGSMHQQTINNIFDQYKNDADGTGAEKNYLIETEKNTKELRNEIFTKQGQKKAWYDPSRRDRRDELKVDASKVADAKQLTENKDELASLTAKLKQLNLAKSKKDTAQNKYLELRRVTPVDNAARASASAKVKAASDAAATATAAQKAAQEAVPDSKTIDDAIEIIKGQMDSLDRGLLDDEKEKENIKILSDKVFEIFNKGGTITFNNIDSLTKGETPGDATKRPLMNTVVFKGDKKCTLTVENEGKITFSYIVKGSFNNTKKYYFVKSSDNVKYGANSITLRVQRDVKFGRQPEKRTLEMTYGDGTEFVFKSTAAAAPAADAAADPADAAAATAPAADVADVASNNKILLNKILSAYLNNLNHLNDHANTAFSADTIEKTAPDYEEKEEEE